MKLIQWDDDVTISHRYNRKLSKIMVSGPLHCETYSNLLTPTNKERSMVNQFDVVGKISI